MKRKDVDRTPQQKDEYLANIQVRILSNLDCLPILGLHGLQCPTFAPLNIRLSLCYPQAQGLLELDPYPTPSALQQFCTNYPVGTNYKVVSIN